MIVRDRNPGRITVINVRKFLTVLLATIALQPYAHAADAPAEKSVATAIADEEEQLDEGLKRFGYLAGLARGCVVDAQRVDLEREALDLNGAIARLLGVDRAFLFASSFGYGTNVVIEVKDCAEVLKNYEQRVAKFRAGRGEQK
jgi:hypothetical protein